MAPRAQRARWRWPSPGRRSWRSRTSLIGAVLVTDRGALDGFRFWQVGSVAGRDARPGARGRCPFLVIGVVLALTAGPTLNAVALGDDVARGLGQQVARSTAGSRPAGPCCSPPPPPRWPDPSPSSASSCPTSCAPLVGADHRRVLLGLARRWGRRSSSSPTSPAASSRRPSEVQAGIVCAVIGAPVLVALVRRIEDAVMP